MRRLFPIIFILVLVALAAYLFRNVTGRINPAVVNDMRQENTQPSSDTPANADQKTVDAVSIPAFSEKQFDGSDFTMGRVLESNDAYTRYFITYKSAGLTISGIMNVPKGGGKFPVLFLNHGYIDPEIYTNGRGLKREQDYLARRGYVVVHSDYRNHAESDRELDTTVPDLRFGYAEDVVNGILALKKADFPFADTDKIGMLGHSMGGGVAEIIAVARPDLVKAFVLFAPVSADQKDNFDRWIKDDPERAEKNIERFGRPEDNPTLWNNASPINFFDKVVAPIVIHHGTADKDVPIAWSERAVQALKDAGKDATLYTYPGEPHEFAGAWPTVMQRTITFFNARVK